MPRRRQRHRRTAGGRRSRRPHRDAPARARRARPAAGSGLLLRHRSLPMPSAAATRWQVAAAPSPPDAFGGIGRTAFDLSLEEPARPLRPVDRRSGIIMSVSSSRRRYLSVWLRRLSTDRSIRGRSPAPAEQRTSAQPIRALVVAEPVKGALRIAAVNDAAARLGLNAGMALADARAMYPRARRRRRRSGGRPASARSDRRLVRPLHAAGRARSAGRPAARHHRLRASVRRRRGAAPRLIVGAARGAGLSCARARSPTRVGCAWAWRAIGTVSGDRAARGGRRRDATLLLPLPLAALRIDAGDGRRPRAGRA